MTMDTRIDDLLPFYVNGTLSEADRTLVEDYLREHPAAQGQLRWYESLQKRLHEDAPPVSSEVGLERALHRIRTEGPAPQGVRKAVQPSLVERVRDWFAAAIPQPVLRPALAGALAVVAVQAVVIGNLASDAEDAASELRAIQATSVTEKGPYLKLNFKPDAREADIRLLLVEVHGSLAAGPGQLGDYYVRVPAGKETESLARVRTSPLVQSAELVPGVPPRQ